MIEDPILDILVEFVGQQVQFLGNWVFPLTSYLSKMTSGTVEHT